MMNPLVRVMIIQLATSPLLSAEPSQPLANLSDERKSSPRANLVKGLSLGLWILRFN